MVAVAVGFLRATASAVAAAVPRFDGTAASRRNMQWLAGCGNGDQGRLGHGEGVGSVQKPARVLLHSALIAGEIDEDDNDVVSCSAGGAHSAIVTRKGALLTAGLNDHGQLGREKAIRAEDGGVQYHQEDSGADGGGFFGAQQFGAARELMSSIASSSTDEFCCVMRRVQLPGPAVAVSCGHFHTLVLLQSGELMAFGSNKLGQLGLTGVPAGTAKNQTPMLLSSIPSVVAMSAGAAHSLAACADGRLLSWGCNSDNRLGFEDTGGDSLGWFSSLMSESVVPVPTPVSALDGLCISGVAAGDMHSLVVDSDGKCFAFGNGRHGQVGAPMLKSVKPVLQDIDHPVEHVAAGGLHSAAVTAYGSLYMWGSNENGSLGLVDNRPGKESTKPAKIESISDVRSISLGWKHSAAVTGDGSVYTWGWGGSVGSMGEGMDCGGGQLGHGNNFDEWQPRKVSGVLTVGVPGTEVVASSVSCGFNHTLLVMENVPSSSSSSTP